MTGRRVSMADVAARAGVSGQTVSRVVNASPNVDPATRERIEAAMAELGYRPHRAARALRTGRSQTIGLVAATLASVGNFRMLQAVVEAATARGYAVTVVTAPGPGDLADAFDRLRDQGADGAIVLNEATALTAGTPAPAGLQLVVVDSAPGSPHSIVQSDHAGGARAATEHLLALGHRSVHHVAGPAASYAAAERERGWRDALAATGVEAPEPLRGDWTSASGYACGLRVPADATAVFVANDQMALGVLRALGDRGRETPADVSVIGFDDITDSADYRPPLTTVRQDFAALGERAVEALVRGLEGAGAHRAETVPTRLIERASTAARG